MLNSADAENMNVYTYFQQRLIKIAISRYQWFGLPSTCNPIFLEKQLALKGYCIFFKDDVTGIYANLPGTGHTYNIYGNPMFFHVEGVDGVYQNADLNPRNSQIIYNNTLHTPEVFSINYHAQNLTLLTRQLQVNIFNQKTPVIFRASDETKLSYVNFYEKMQRNEPYMVVKEDFMAKDEASVSKTIDVRPPYVADKIRIEIEKEWGEALTDLGIFYSPVQKKERQTQMESAGNYQAVLAIRSEGEMARNYAIEKIKEKFPELGEIRVQFNNKVEESLQFTEGVREENGNIYNNNPRNL